MTRVFKRLLGLVVIGLVGPYVLMGASCQGSNVKLNGRTYKPENEGEKKWVEQAMAAKESQDKSTEEKAWGGLLKEYPNSQAVPTAQYRLGHLAYEQGRYADAAGLLESALKGNSLTGPKRAKTRLLHGQALLKIGQAKAAIEAFEDAYQQLSEEEQKPVAAMILRAAKESGDQRALIQWQARLLPTMDASQQTEAKAALLQAIDGRLSSAELQVLYAKRGETLTFPFDYIAMRLALLSFHQQDFKACDEILDALSGSINQEHSLYKRVQSLRAQRREVLRVQPNVLGVLYPKTGYGAGLGKLVRNAIELATSGLEGKVQVVFEDTGSQASTAVRALERLVKEHRVVAIFGPVLSDVSLPVAHRAQELGVPLFSISLVETLPDIGSYIFRNNLTRSQMGTAIARYAVKKLSISRFTAFYPDGESGRIQVGAFWREVERLGAKMVGVESYPADVKNFVDPAQRLVGRMHLGLRPLWYKFSGQLRQAPSGFLRKRLYRNLVKQFPPVVDFDAIFIPDSIEYVSMIAPTLAQQDIEVKLHYPYWEKQVEERYKALNKPLKFVQLLGTNGWNNEDIFTREPRHVVGGIFTVRYCPWAAKRGSLVQNFVDNYRNKFPGEFDPKNPKPPSYVSAYAYDTIQILLHVVEKFAPKTREAFRDQLLKIKDFAGVTGPMTIQSNGETIAPIQFLVAHRDKKFKIHGTSADIE